MANFQPGELINHFGAEMMKRPKPLEVLVEGLHCRLIHLDDARYGQLAGNSLAIREDHGFLLGLLLNQRRQGKMLNLAEVYAAFKARFGESGRCFDDYKGAFSFPFEVVVFRGETVYLYVLNVVNWRSSIEFHFRKVILPDDRKFDRMLVHPPFPTEFSADGINTVVAFLYGFAQGVVETLCRCHIEEFVKKVDSNLILFGFRQGTFFEEQYEDSDEFFTAWKETKAAIDRSAMVGSVAAGLRRRLYDRFGPIPEWVEVWIASATPAQMDA